MGARSEAQEEPRAKRPPGGVELARVEPRLEDDVVHEILRCSRWPPSMRTATAIMIGAKRL